MSVRNASSDLLTRASAVMTASERRATSASASTTSIGAIVPISTFDRLLRRDSLARSSDWRATCREATAALRFQYAYFTLRTVISTVWWSSMSDRSRFIRLTTSCWRALSIFRLRSSGCVKLKVRLAPVAGFGLE